VPVISVLGTKGGVGKSTVAMGIAAWLSKIQDDMVLLIDGDIHVRTIELKMCPKTDITFSEILEGKHELVDAIYRCQLKSADKWVFPELSILPAGSRFLPMGSRDIIKYVMETVQKFDAVMQKLRGYFTYIIVDTPASITFEHFILTAIADGLIFVVTPDVGSVFSSRQTVEGLKEMMGVPTVGTVINKVPRGMKAMENWIDYTSSIAPVIGTVEYDELVDDAFRRNLPVVAAYPRAASSLSLKNIAEKVMELDVRATSVVPKFRKTWVKLFKAKPGEKSRRKSKR
jgi:MinD-like ATPase involved in chromosome partitioning or flagellar assembly